MRLGSWILQSRIFAARGDASGALKALKTSLNELGMLVPDDTTWDECDIAYKKLEVSPVEISTYDHYGSCATKVFRSLPSVRPTAQS